MTTRPDTAKETQRSTTVRIAFFASFLLLSTQAVAQSAIEPPSIGQETKGTPAITETNNNHKAVVPSADTVEDDKNQSLFGKAKVTELRRENGQVYLIELEHSSGSKQYIQENDSDGKIESTSNDIEETPNLPKWKLGSW